MGYKSGWVSVNGIPTLVRTWGGWIEEDIKSDKIVLLITGNPGITDFYVKFLHILYIILNIPVWTLSHAGGQLPKDSLKVKFPSLKGNESLYNLSGQVNHKREFIKQYISKSKKIYLIGHSVGAKMCVELMKNEEFAERVVQAHLLFPTLEHISATKNGWLFQNITQRVQSLLLFLCWLIEKIPYRARFCVLKTVYLLRLKFDVDKYYIHGVLKLISPKVVRNSIFLAIDEMANINELDDDVYRNHKSKIFIYYGQKDGWTEPRHYEVMRACHPEVKADMLDNKFQHAFVFDTSKEMAQILARSITKID